MISSTTVQLCPGTVIYQDLSQVVPWVKVIRRSEEDGDLTVLLTWRDGPGQNTLAGMYLYCNKLKLVTYNFGIKYQMVNLFIYQCFPRAYMIMQTYLDI